MVRSTGEVWVNLITSQFKFFAYKLLYQLTVKSKFIGRLFLFITYINRISFVSFVRVSSKAVPKHNEESFFQSP